MKRIVKLKQIEKVWALSQNEHSLGQVKPFKAYGGIYGRQNETTQNLVSIWYPKSMYSSHAMDKPQTKEKCFDDCQFAYQQKSYIDLLTSISILSLCRIKYLVQGGPMLSLIVKRGIGQNYFNALVKKTIFKQFVGGEDLEDVTTAIDNLGNANVLPILQYAAESDLNLKQVNYEETAEGFRQSIIRASQVPQKGIAEFKISALVNPESLNKFSNCINKLQLKNWTQEEIKLVDDMLSVYPGSSQMSQKQKLYSLQLEQILQLLNKNDLNETSKLEFESITKDLQDLEKRVSALSQECVDRNVKILMDAEQSYFQPALDFLILKMQMKYNKQGCYIFNTHQCYLKNSPQKAQDHIRMSKILGFKLAIKQVRGAYIEIETKRSEDYNEIYPIWDNIQQTHDSYNGIAKLFLQEVQKGNTELMIASHNQETIELALQYMNDLNITPQHPGIYFAQLYGMADYLTFPLAKMGCRTYKYLPYGDINTVLPFLLRRAQENSSILSGSKKEIGLMQKEIIRRALAF